MAGCYVHIPFCKSRCYYCNFFSTTKTGEMDKLTEAIVKEMQLRRDYLPQHRICTVYMGGGTPSVLALRNIESILKGVEDIYGVDENAEITLEVNPDDVTYERALTWKEMGFNRVSMGIQSWDDKVLKIINRRHTCKQAEEAIERLKKSGFKNISVDLIYGLPYQDVKMWKLDVKKTLSFDLQHISSYGLSFEPGTRLSQMLEEGHIREQEDDTYNEMYDYLCDCLRDNGFEHYEVSNFSKPGFRSRHNSSYWNDTPYFGFGPGAHSYNCIERQWNVEDLEEYITKIASGVVPHEKEILTSQQQWEEYVMLRMRTREGMDLNYAGERFGVGKRESCQRLAVPYLSQGLLQYSDNHLSATRKGLKILNKIIEDLIG